LNRLAEFTLLATLLVAAAHAADDDGEIVIPVAPDAKLPAGALSRLLPPDAGPKSVAISPDGTLAALASEDGSVRVFAIATAKLQLVIQAQATMAHDVAFAPDGKHLAACGADGKARLYDVKSGLEIRAFEGHEEGTKSLCFSPDGGWLATSGEDGTLKVWDTETGELARTLDGHEAHVDRVAWSADGRTLLSEAADSTARLWNPRETEVRRVLPERDGEVAALALAPDGELGITTRGDRTWHVFNTQTGADVRVLRGQLGNGTCVAFAPDGRSVYTGATDGSLRQWDLASGIELRRFLGDGHPRMVALAIDRSGRRLVSASADRNILVWDLAQPPADPGPGGKAEIPANEKDPAQRHELLWKLLGSDAYDQRIHTLLSLLRQPDDLLALARAKSPPPKALTQDETQDLLARLDDPSFGTREAASQEARDLGSRLSAFLRQAREHHSAEVRWRARQMGSDAAQELGIREVLVVEALGWLNSEAAREQLKALASGDPEHPLTEHAQNVLGRERNR